jgi:4-alpha-glucanotransferase
VRRYLGRSGEDISWDLVRAALASTADTAIVPLQDVLDLGSEARMNTPGRADGNWAWRARLDGFSADTAARLADLTRLYGR